MATHSYDVVELKHLRREIKPSIADMEPGAEGNTHGSLLPHEIQTKLFAKSAGKNLAH